LNALVESPVVGTSFTLDTFLAGGEISFGIEWLGAREMIREATSLYPGIVTIKSGYVPVGECEQGSGDPFFVSFAASDDPPLMQIFHDRVVEGPDLPSDAYWAVVGSLSEFFERARVLPGC